MSNRIRLSWCHSPVLVVVCLFSILNLNKTGAALSAEPPQPVRIVLENGVTVLMLSLPETDQVGIETFYEVGFIHEPDQMTQAAHLLEHLVCVSATESFPQNESFKRLNRIGTSNAETLPDWTHYDYMIPASELEFVLRVEAERLTSLRFHRALIEYEARRCYQEADFAERQPQTGMAKHAMMVCSQAWRFGRESALVRGAMEQFSIEQLQQFHRSTYHPGNLTIVMVGGFQQDEAEQLVRRHLGSIAVEEKVQPIKTTDWSKVARQATVRWDTNLRGICIAYPPPVNNQEQIVLSLFGTLLHQQLNRDPEIKKVADAVFTSNHLWRVGDLPFVVYTTAKPDAQLEDVQRVLEQRMPELIKRAQRRVARRVRGQASMLAGQISMMTWKRLDLSARQLARNPNMDPERATQMVLGHAALQWGSVDRLLGPKPEQMVSSISELTDADCERLIAEYLDPSRQRITLLKPLEQPKGQSHPSLEPPATEMGGAPQG